MTEVAFIEGDALRALLEALVTLIRDIVAIVALLRALVGA